MSSENDQPKEKSIAYFSGGYGREGRIRLTQSVCNVCKQGPKPVIAIDASEGEYNEGCICQQCAQEAFK